MKLDIIMLITLLNYNTADRPIQLADQNNISKRLCFKRLFAYSIWRSVGEILSDIKQNSADLKW